MGRNVFHDETRSEQWPVGLADFTPGDKTRLQPTIAAILDTARRASQSKGDQLVHGALRLAIIERIVNDDLLAAYVALASILGLEVPSREVRKPLHTSEGRNGAGGKALPIREEGR